MTTAHDAGAARQAGARRPGRWHWAEYGLEAAQLGLFMVSACLVVSLIEHPASPLRAALPLGWVRRLVIGTAMGLTAIGLIYSPWGKRSGAHMNPAVTLTFFLLRKIEPRDALSYVLAQFCGAAAGVALSRRLLGDVLAHAAVHFVVTRPGAPGVAVAFGAETGISALLMWVVLATQNSARFAPLTGAFCGVLVALYIAVEAPLSGMSMNPARSLGSALIAGEFRDLWLYFLAPGLGMTLAAAAFARLGSGARACPKLRHADGVPCIFCSARQPLSSAPSGAANTEVNP